MKLITTELEKRFAEIGSQEESKDPIIVAKFFDPVGSATWFAISYDPKSRICMGYVTGLAYDEWGSFSINELESIKRPFGLGIERDIHFSEKTFAEQFVQKPSIRKQVQKENINKEQDIER